jgi:hypothetical protein
MVFVPFHDARQAANELTLTAGTRCPSSRCTRRPPSACPGRAEPCTWPTAWVCCATCTTCT